MRKLYALFIAFLISFPIFSKDYISDKQYFIFKNSTEAQEGKHAERLISIDESDNKASIQVPSGKTITRNIELITEKFTEQGKEYDSYYQTSQGEKIFIGDDEIVFEANRTLGAVFIYKLKK